MEGKLLVIYISNYMRVFRVGEISVSHLKHIRTMSSSLCRDPTIILLPYHHCPLIVNVLTLVWYGRSVSHRLYQDTLIRYKPEGLGFDSR